MIGVKYWRFNASSCQIEMVGVTPETPGNAESSIICEWKIPKDLGNTTTLTYMSLEANQFSGFVPPKLGDLTNLQTLVLSSNNLTGNLPMGLARLRNLTDFRINDNNFRGIIPDFIQNWKQLTRL
ncbi:probable leucine-rich repeat receptor-like serine/threonine-protein kinase At3g14840 isoform X2 [Quercus robur]|nr:probable leucine-rich repeat receptor-like serine/threonine-protein kinase At3g14840 isoform X2 [Quercus robur]XP_050290667.1 probable leucine-rich repeat receptor-like serine/threonine-protein kinase At3g14840 isoform X2 [Quercus robur]XP_050290668.1 probable leucine-rich repeat receptor-like serine/threonine-protein kinase At3g14840 isoform X2 [Quercus robur]